MIDLSAHFAGTEPEYHFGYSKDADIDPYECMYLNESMKEPAGLPEMLSIMIDDLTEYYRKGMYRHFEIEVENLEGLVKNCHSVGEISDEQAKAIFKMFGWPW